jgi:hypothetical protein
MAKNIFESLLKLTGFNPPNQDGYYDPSVYRQEPAPVKAQPVAKGTSQPSRVEQYLAKKQGIKQTTANNSDQLTGVARYLAQKEQAMKTPSESNQATMTGVDRYLAKKTGGTKKTASKPVASTKPLTGVDKYLADKKKTNPPVAKTTTPKPATKAEPKKATQESNKAEAPKSQPKTSTAKTEPEKPVKAEAKPAAKKAVKETKDLAATADQCQAATQKGSRCRRKNNLAVLEQSINAQQYRFAVCSQHKNDDFVPFADFIQ